MHVAANKAIYKKVCSINQCKQCKWLLPRTCTFPWNPTVGNFKWLKLSHQGGICIWNLIIMYCMDCTADTWCMCPSKSLGRWVISVSNVGKSQWVKFMQASQCLPRVILHPLQDVRGAATLPTPDQHVSMAQACQWRRQHVRAWCYPWNFWFDGSKSQRFIHTEVISHQGINDPNISYEMIQKCL